MQGEEYLARMAERKRKKLENKKKRKLYEKIT
jgi:hypothetical protein